MINEMNSDFNYFLKTATWDKEAHGLFDYEYNDNIKIFNIKSDGYIQRNDKDNETLLILNKNENSFFLTGDNINNTTKNGIAQLYKQYNNYYLATNVSASYDYNLNNIDYIQHKLWVNIKQIENKGVNLQYISKFDYTLSFGDLIRFGRVQYLVSDVYIKDSNNNDDIKNNIDSYIYKPIICDNYIDNSNNCIRCHKKDNSDDNPLIRICSCIGNKNYMHLKCYKNYIKSSNIFGMKELKLQNIYILTTYNLICEHCKQPLNTFISRNNIIRSILPYKIEKKNISYFILTSMNYIRENIFTTSVIIFYFPNMNEEYYLGRGHEATFRINDISISRVHSKIYMKDNKFKIDDMGSKFGTLLLLKNDVNVEDIKNNKMVIESGRSIFWIE